MNRKNLLTRIGEAIDQYQAERQQTHSEDQAIRQPAPSRRWAARLLPNPGTVIFTVLVVAALLWAQSAGALTLNAPAATSTGVVAYQGRLANTGGTPLTGVYNMIFRLYAATIGGSPLWEEQWTGSNSVQVSDGLFNVMLGSLTPIPQAVVAANPNLFLGITVGTDGEMSPRVQLGSVPFAVQALTVPDGSITTAKIADGAVTGAKLSEGGYKIPVFSSGTTIRNWQVTACDGGNYTIPGLNLSVHLDKPSILDISFSGLVRNTLPGGALYGRLFVDGVFLETGAGDQLGGCRNASESIWCTAASIATSDVPAGDHTVSARASCDGSGATGNVWSGSLVVRAFPK